MTKGQLILKCPFGVFKSPKKTIEIFSRISALASKIGYIKKRVDFIPLIGGFYFDSLTLPFLFDFFLEPKARNPGKKFVGFLEEVLTPKGHFEIN